MILMIASPYSRWSEASTRAPKKLAVSCSSKMRVSVVEERGRKRGKTHLKSVTDTENGDASVEHRRVNAGSTLLVDGEGRAGKDDTCRETR
jgi:hypothetical protein